MRLPVPCRSPSRRDAPARRRGRDWAPIAAPSILTLFPDLPGGDPACGQSDQKTLASANRSHRFVAGSATYPKLPRLVRLYHSSVITVAFAAAPRLSLLQKMVSSNRQSEVHTAPRSRSPAQHHRAQAYKPRRRPVFHARRRSPSGSTPGTLALALLRTVEPCLG
jgi:hypothetical protein